MSTLILQNKIRGFFSDADDNNQNQNLERECDEWVIGSTTGSMIVGIEDEKTPDLNLVSKS